MKEKAFYKEAKEIRRILNIKCGGIKCVDCIFNNEKGECMKRKLREQIEDIITRAYMPLLWKKMED